MPRHLPKAGAGAFARLSEPYTRRGLPLAVPVDLAAVVPGGGGLPSLSPATPAFSLLCCPPSPKGKDRPPAPFPVGRGRDYCFLMQGASPLASPRLGGARHWLCLRKTGFWALNRELAPAGAAGIRAVKNRHPAGCLLGKVCTCRKRFSAGVPGAKPPAK